MGISVDNLPTFDEYQAMRDQYVDADDADLGFVDAGSQYLKHMVQRHIYEIEGYRCKTLEGIERVAKSMGIPLKALDYRAEIIPLSGHKCDILVKFMPKQEIERRSQWQ